MLFRKPENLKMRKVHSKFGDISVIGLGCLQSADPTVIKAALKDEINFFVTAEAYGDDKQREVGAALSSAYDKVFIATKVGINFMGKTPEEQFTQSRQQIHQSVLKCISLIGKKPLDLVALHRLDDIHHVPEENNAPAWIVALDELIKLQKEGYIKSIGLSEPTPEQLEIAIKYASERGSAISSVECAYSIATRRVETNGLKEICDREGIIMIAYSSVLRGLTDSGLQNIKKEDFDLSSEEFRHKVFKTLGISGNFILENIDMFSLKNIKNNISHMLEFQTCAAKYNVTPTQLALAWVQHQGAIPIPGSKNPDHVVENNKSAGLVDVLEKSGAFAELNRLFPPGTFQGDPNPVAIAGALDANSEKLNQGTRPKIQPTSGMV